MKYYCEYDDESSWGDSPQDAYNALINYLTVNQWLADEIPGPDACLFYKMVAIDVELKTIIVEVQ